MKNIDNYKLLHTNKFHDVKKHTFKVEGTPIKKENKLFLKELLDLSSMEISLNIFKPDEEMPFFHKHKENEEVYVILKGEAQFIIDEQIFDLEEGSILSIQPKGERYYRNISSEDDLLLLVIQAKENTLEKSTIQDGIIVD